MQRVGSTEKDTSCTGCDSTDVKKMVSSFSCSFADGKSFSPSSTPARSFGGG
ncbi:MAG: hypothetical protein HY754_01320 [Nitrospirae bacterium]|nr:hypothetical protein [Nitrospirota bacterium]